jgi:hypothetical protein
MIPFILGWLACISCVVETVPYKYQDKLPPLPEQVVDEQGNAVGWLSAYGQLPTDATLEYGQEVLGLPEDVSRYDGVIAVLECSDVGKDATLLVNDVSYTMLAFDCAYPHDHGPKHLAGGRRYMLENQIVGEVGWYFWQKYPDLIGDTEATLIIHED